MLRATPDQLQPQGLTQQVASERLRVTQLVHSPVCIARSQTRVCQTLDPQPQTHNLQRLTRVHIRAEGRGLHFKGCSAPQANGNAPLVLRDLPPIGRDHRVGCQLAPVLPQERGHVGAADLLLPLQHDLHGPGQSVWERFHAQHESRLMRGAMGVLCGCMYCGWVPDKGPTTTASAGIWLGCSHVSIFPSAFWHASWRQA